MTTPVAPQPTTFLEWFASLGIPVPRVVDPAPFTRSQLTVKATVSALRVATYNVWRLASREQTKRDFQAIRELADVVGWGEARVTGKGKQLEELSKEASWGYYQGTQSDTSISWRLQRYALFFSDSLDIEDSLWRRTQEMSVSVPIVGLEDRVSGERFYVMCAHTQVRGRTVSRYSLRMRKQYRQIKAEMTRLEQTTGLPVVLLGDLNNGKALEYKVAPEGYVAYAHKIDYIIYKNTRWLLERGGVVQGIGFDHKRDKNDGPMSSDHPLVWAHLVLRPPARVR